MEWREVSERFAQWLVGHEKTKGKRSGDRVDGRCPKPGHEDKNPSFSYYVEKAGWSCSCGRGKASDLMKELGVNFGQDLEHVAPSIVAQYDYCDASGTIRYQVQRLVPKSFRQRSAVPSGNGVTGSWREGKGAMDGVELLPYKLDELVKLPADTRLLVVDGEKDVETAWKILGVPATCATGGMARWTIDMARKLPDGIEIVVVADKDRDGKGRKDAQRLVEILGSLRRKARVAEMPGDGIKDLTDWVQRGGELSKLDEALSERSRWDEVARSPIVPTSQLAHLIDAQIEYSVRPICPKGSLIIIQGPPKSGKSVFSLHIAGCAAVGERIGGSFHVEHPMKVLFVEYEDAPLLVVKRLSRYMAGMHRDPRLLPDNLLFCDYPDLWLDSQRHKDLLIEEIRQRGIELVVIDTLSYVHQAEDENSAADMKPVMANLKRIAKDSGASILLVHHTGKGGKDKSISERGRGSSVIAAAADAILDWGDRKKSNKTPVEFISKFDDGFEFEVEYIPMTDGSVEWKVNGGEEEQKEDQREATLKAVGSITAVDKPLGVTIQELSKALPKISPQSVYRHVRALEREGKLAISIPEKRNEPRLITVIK